MIFNIGNNEDKFLVEYKPLMSKCNPGKKKKRSIVFLIYFNWNTYYFLLTVIIVNDIFFLLLLDKTNKTISL